MENGQSDSQGPHAVRDNQWVGYDDPRIMGIKVSEIECLFYICLIVTCVKGVIFMLEHYAI